MVLRMQTCSLKTGKPCREKDLPGCYNAVLFILQNMGLHRTWQSWLWLITKRALFVYAGLLVLGFLLQKYLIYFPSKAREDELLRLAERNGMRPWRDRANRLIGWRTSLPEDSQKPRNRMVVFHGNAGYALHRIYYAHGFHGISEGTAIWELFLFEYPGYGARAGSKNEKDISDAARRAISEMLQEDARPIYLVGESLGSGFASRLAAENPKGISGLFLVTPLTRLADVAASHYPILPVRWMLLEQHNAQKHLKSYPGPVAFLVAGRDEVMKNGLGERLYRQYSGSKRLWTQPEAGHNTLDLAPGLPLWQEVADFLEHPS